MSFVEAVSYCLSNYFTFSGRGSRPEFWWFTLAVVLASIAGSIIDAVTGYPVLAFLVSLATLIPGLAATVRRLHDTDRSGWWILLAFIPLVGAIILIVWEASAGAPGPNRYGAPPPRGATSQPVRA